MSRVMTFSRYFPAYHPKAGQPTNFMEKLWEALEEDGCSIEGTNLVAEILKWTRYEHEPKYHTIRAGNRWKAGDWFSPRAWSGKPYHSKQVIIAQDIQVKKVWDLQIEGFIIHLNKILFTTNMADPRVTGLAKNDGLSLMDFWDWFPYKRGKVFTGQIISWNENINY